MARTLVFPDSTYTVRVREEQLALPTLDEVVRVGVSRRDLPATAEVLVSYLAEISLDGGTTWRLLCGANTSGIVGTPLPGLGTESWIETGCPEPDNASRLLRVRFEPVEGLRTSVFVESRASRARRPRGPEHHSVAFDAVASTSWGAAQNPSWTHTPAGTPTAVGIGFGGIHGDGLDNSAISSVTYGGTACALAVARASAAVVYIHSEIWALGAPTAGAQTVQINFAVSDQYGIAGSITVTGSDTSTVFSNTASGAAIGTDPSTACTSATGELVMDTITLWDTTNINSVGADQTSRWALNPFGNLSGGGSTEPGGASITMSWDTNGAQWTQAVASFKEGAGGAGYVPSRLHMSGGALPMTGGLFQ